MAQRNKKRVRRRYGGITVYGKRMSGIRERSLVSIQVPLIFDTRSSRERGRMLDTKKSAAQSADSQQTTLSVDFSAAETRFPGLRSPARTSAGFADMRRASEAPRRHI